MVSEEVREWWEGSMTAEEYRSKSGWLRFVYSRCGDSARYAMADLALRNSQLSLCAWREDMSMEAFEAAFDCLAHARAQVREFPGIPFDVLDVAVNPKR